VAQLLIRPSLNDHEVVADLIAPAMASLWRSRTPIGQLVVDAHIAAVRPRFADAASEAGIPLLIDPMTQLLQSPIDPKSTWSKLPFAEARPVAAGDLDPVRLVESVIDFQVEQGATQILAPYLYAAGPSDPAFAMSIRLLAHSAHYLREADIPLPLVAVFCGQLRGFARRDAQLAGNNRFLAAARDHDASAVGLYVSPAGAPGDSYAKVAELFRLAAAVTDGGIPALAWRQGVYGPALVAAGMAGYESGIGTQEQTNVTRQASNRREKPTKKRGGGGAGIYLETLGRSVPKRVAETLFGSMEMRAKLMCDDDGCCPGGVRDTLDKGRPHAVRSRDRQLAELTEQPHRRWRIHHVEQQAHAAVTLARQSNSVLEDAGAKDRIKFRNLESLAQVLSELRQVGEMNRSA
jgi:hypothetical protein